MNCMNCGAFLSDMDLDYCTHCGCNVLVQKKVDYLSKYYYNQGLEKASIRDLSGAINCLKQSLTYNKSNIQARNLLGLVYFETGEVVAALSEWVISKNLQPGRNLASEYIDKLQSSPNKLEAINETIKKYNHALALCREGHEDMAAIRLKKILAQNSKLIKGYHLLALIQIKNSEWNKARRTLRKAAKIDKTNTTTLRFLREVDEQTGVTTKLEHKGRGFFKNSHTETEHEEGLFGEQTMVQAPVYKTRGRASLFFTLMTGFAAGALAFWLLAVPAIRQGIYREANKQIVKYSESLASQGAELSKAQNLAQESGDTMEAAAKQLDVEKKKAASYEALMSAYAAMIQENWDEAALKIQQVYVDQLSDNVMGIYNTICNNTGVTGIESSEEEDGSSESEEDVAGDGYSEGDSGDGYSEGGSGDGYSEGNYSGDGYSEGDSSGDTYSEGDYSGDSYSNGDYSSEGY